MVKEINTSISIHATPGKIWSILTDFEKYPQWNPFIISLKGEVAVGKTITVKIQPPQSSPMTFKPTVLVFQQNKELKWLGKLFISGLFDGEHRFEIIDHQNGTVTFHHSEIFKGIFVRFFNTQKTQTGFQLMNQKLKELAESS